MICKYCYKERGSLHSCPQLAKALADIKKITDDIHASMETPGQRPLTSNELKLRSDYRRQTATQVKLAGGNVRPEYE